jgi:hypothetical protein
VVRAVALALGLALLAACSDDPPPAPLAVPAEIVFCGDVREDLTCVEEVRRIEPEVRYFFLATGPTIPARQVTLEIVRLTPPPVDTIVSVQDEVAADADGYANVFAVRTPGTYVLRVSTVHGRWAERSFDAVAPIVRAPGTPVVPEPAAVALPIEIACPETCDAVQTELARIRQWCIDTPTSPVRQVLTGAAVAPGCCGLAAGAYEQRCRVPRTEDACHERWSRACTSG